MDTFDLLVVFKDGEKRIIKDVVNYKVETTLADYSMDMGTGYHTRILYVNKENDSIPINWSEVRYCGRLSDFKYPIIATLEVKNDEKNDDTFDCLIVLKNGQEIIVENTKQYKAYDRRDGNKVEMLFIYKEDNFPSYENKAISSGAIFDWDEVKYCGRLFDLRQQEN